MKPQHPLRGKGRDAGLPSGESEPSEEVNAVTFCGYSPPYSGVELPDRQEGIWQASSLMW